MDIFNYEYIILIYKSYIKGFFLEQGVFFIALQKSNNIDIIHIYIVFFLLQEDLLAGEKNQESDEEY